MSLENAFYVQSSISHGRGRGRSKYGGRGRNYVRGGCSRSLRNTSGRSQNPINNHSSN